MLGPVWVRGMSLWLRGVSRLLGCVVMGPQALMALLLSGVSCKVRALLVPPGRLQQ